MRVNTSTRRTETCNSNERRRNIAHARADVFQWEYVNPANAAQGKQQSATLCAGGAGENAVPGAFLPSRELTMAYLIGADLTDTTMFGTNLTDADLSASTLTNAQFLLDFDGGAPLFRTNLSGANLTNTFFHGTDLTDANFTGTQLRDANLSLAYGFTAAQLYSTASYQDHDLRGSHSVET